MLEAIAMAEEFWANSSKLSNDARSGDHIWWISDVRKFQTHYPQWSFQYDIRTILREIVEATRARN